MGSQRVGRDWACAHTHTWTANYEIRGIKNKQTNKNDAWSRKEIATLTVIFSITFTPRP